MRQAEPCNRAVHHLQRTSKHHGHACFLIDNANMSIGASRAQMTLLSISGIAEAGFTGVQERSQECIMAALEVISA